MVGRAGNGEFFWLNLDVGTFAFFVEDIDDRAECAAGGCWALGSLGVELPGMTNTFSSPAVLSSLWDVALSSDPEVGSLLVIGECGLPSS